MNPLSNYFGSHAFFGWTTSGVVHISVVAIACASWSLMPINRGDEGATQVIEIEWKTVAETVPPASSVTARLPSDSDESVDNELVAPANPLIRDDSKDVDSVYESTFTRSEPVALRVTQSGTLPLIQKTHAEIELNERSSSHQTRERLERSINHDVCDEIDLLAESERIPTSPPDVITEPVEVPIAPAVPSSASSAAQSKTNAISRYPVKIETESPPPLYPKECLVERREGVAIIKVTVAANGTVANAQLHRSSGDSRLDEAAIVAVRKWKYQVLESHIATGLKPFGVRVEFELSTN